VAVLARELSWQGTAREYGLNWKSVATIVKRAVQYGLKHRKRPPVHVIGIDEVSRRKGQVYLTVVYDLERRVLLWVGDDRTEEAGAVFHRRNGQAALPNAPGRVHGHVGDVRQARARARGQRANPV
jgi:transposase